MTLYGFVMLLLIGFALVRASAFTAAYSRRWGGRGGQLATSIFWSKCRASCLACERSRDEYHGHLSF
jgi:hypothetical protein